MKEAALWVDLPVEQWIYCGTDTSCSYPHIVFVGGYVRARFKTEAAAQALINELRAVMLAVPVRREPKRKGAK